METFLSSLTPRENALFLALLDIEVASKSYLLEKVWGFPADVAKRTRSRSVDVTVMRLRDKMQGRSFTIETLHNVGYRLLAGV